MGKSMVYYKIKDRPMGKVLRVMIWCFQHTEEGITE